MLRKSLKFLFCLFLSFLIFSLVFEKTVAWANGGGGGYVPNGSDDPIWDDPIEQEGEEGEEGAEEEEEEGEEEEEQESECTSGETQDCGTCGIQSCVSGQWEESCDETSEPDDDKTNSWDEYRCQEEGCGNQYIEERRAYQDYTRSVSCLGGGKWKKGTWKKDGSPYYDTPSTIEQCDLDWQLCSGSNEWSKSTRSCDCAGTCLETPENPRYYNNPNYPTPPPESYEAEKYEPEESEDSNNIFLPVKLDWDNVKAWKNGWQEEDEVLKECSEDCFQSYLIEIDNTATGNFSKALTQDSEYNPTQNQGACFLKSGITHNWNVSACCNTDGTNCSSKSEWDFTTNSAPEPILPADPDWKEEEIKPGVEIPVFLDWCDVDDAQSFRIRMYYIDNEAEVCHPSLTFGGQCDSKIIRTENRPPPYYDPAKDTLYSDFQDNEGFFTKDTEYRWELATCIYENGVNCSDFGQKWGFDTTLVSLPDLQLESPPNDLNGEQAVGFPVILKWKYEPGMNSFVYDIYKENPGELTGNVNLSQKVFDYPTLSLNTFYTWRIKPCWDYEGLDCEDWPVDQEWVFKTTGAPPQLTSPENNALNVPIPIKLDWNSVSGAKSYNYWLYSNGQLIANGDSIENSVLIKYDPASKEPKQETTYSWQVTTCTDLEGNICGEKTELQYFKTFKLSAPLNLLPENDETLFTYQMPKGFSWNSDAKYFKFTLDYIQKAEEEIGDCPLKKEEKTITGNSYFVSLACLGEYQWQIQACLDENCNEQGEPSVQNFTLDQTIPPAKFGLVPCGRSSYNPDTPWDEREPCQFKHLFILLRNILDFLLWRVTLIILLLLVVATAMIFYFSIGAPALIIDIRGAWRAAGKGFAIIFISWMLINLFLNFLGYQVGIFGQWWQINF